MKTKSIITFFLLITSFLSVAKNETKPLTADLLLDNLRKDLTALQANFTQYEVDANNKTSEKSTGIVWLQAPNKFKWSYQKPIPQLIVASGKTVWIYDEDLEQVTIKKQKNKQNPIYVLLDKNRTQQNYTAKLLPQNKQDKQAKNSLQWVSLIPKQASEDLKIVWLGLQDNQLKVLKLQNQLDNIVVFEFNQIQKNPKLDADFFNFQPPKGTDIIREDAINPEF